MLYHEICLLYIILRHVDTPKFLRLQFHLFVKTIVLCLDRPDLPFESVGEKKFLSFDKTRLASRRNFASKFWSPVDEELCVSCLFDSSYPRFRSQIDVEKKSRTSFASRE